MILTCRLVLNLRRVARERYTVSLSGDIGLGQELSTIPQLQFATNRFLGNIGAPLRNDEQDSEHEQEE